MASELFMPIEEWERRDALNLYFFWLKIHREKGIREGRFEPLSDHEHEYAKAVTE